MNALVLHVGIDKTGSTAIQRYLHENQLALRAHGLNYVEAARGAAYNHDRLWRTSLSGDLALWQSVADEVSCSPLPTHVVSHEGLYTLKPENFDAIRGILRGLDLKVVVYLRRQSDFVCSGLVQRVKQGDQKYLDEYSDEELLKLGKNYEKLLGKLLHLADEGQLVVRCFESSSLGRRSVSEDFLDAIGAGPFEAIPANDSASWNPNPTPPVEVVQGLERLRRMGLPPNLYSFLVNVALSRFPGDNSTFISDRLLDRIDRRQEGGNRRVAQRWFGRNELFLDERKYSFREPNMALVSAFWSCVWRYLSAYRMPAWSGEEAVLAELCKSGHASVDTEAGDRSSGILLRLPVTPGLSTYRLVLGSIDAQREEMEICVNGICSRVPVSGGQMELMIDRRSLVATENLVDITIPVASAGLPLLRSMTLHLAPPVKQARPSKSVA